MRQDRLIKRVPVSCLSIRLSVMVPSMLYENYFLKTRWTYSTDR